jgi:hypothetical protein
MGWVVLGVLTALAALNALGIALRAAPSGRAELAMVASAAWFALVAAPVLALGYANVLTPGSLLAASFALSAGTFAVLVRHRPIREHLRECATAARGMARMPVDGLREAARARSVVLVGLVVCGGILAAAFVWTVFAPNETWDGLLYHEPIVGFAIQNHGFSTVALPMSEAVQCTNGYPRLVESVSLWLVIFTDKTLVELPNDLAAPAMMLAVYVLSRRFGDRVTAMGWACVAFLMPQIWSQLCQTYIDVAVAFFALVAIHFATRLDLRISDAMCATLGMALLLASKGSGISTVPPIAVLVLVRLLRRHARARPLAAIATATASAVLLAGLALVTPLRNWAAFENPLWPISYDNRALGIHWSGLITLDEAVSNRPIRKLVEVAYDIPIGGMGDVIARGYGYGIAWVVIPLGMVGLVAGILAATAEAFRLKERSAASSLGLVLLLVVTSVLTTPTLAGQNARYDVHIVAGLMVAVTWLFAGRRWERAREGAVAASIVLSIIPLFWMKGPGWYWVSTRYPEDVLAHPLTSRRYLRRPTFDLLARQRIEELHPDDCVVFDQDVAFVGALWNFEFSNRVKYVPYHASGDFLDAIDKCAATWVAVGKAGDARAALQSTNRWELVGEMTEDGEVVFRRKR